MDKMRFSTRFSLLVAIILLLFYVSFFLDVRRTHKEKIRSSGEIGRKIKYESISREVLDVKEKILNETLKTNHNSEDEKIAILIFSCNRKAALDHLIRKVLKYRKDAEKFPIFVSQDCTHQPTADVALSFKNVRYIKHEHTPYLNINKHYRGYYSLAAHYKKGLDYVLLERKFPAVIVLEDDLDISPDIFEYFSATRRLMKKDPSIWCVSAWNDNGMPELINSSDPELLYRSDFFAGLGWMMDRNLWIEVQPKWPISFWDDWLREPEQRKGRQCIRPEIGRTGMTNYGKTGSSKGMFFDQYLSRIVVNKQFVDFNSLDLSYLEKENYDKKFRDLVYKNSLLFSDWNEFLHYFSKHETEKFQSRIPYDDYIDFVKTNGLTLMPDTRANIPRTAYKGIVTFLHENHRVFLIPRTS